MSDPVKMLHSVVSLDYERPPTLVARQYADAVKQHKLLGHRCPECKRIYTPPRGYCPVCTVPTGKDEEVELSDHGVLLTFTVTRPEVKLEPRALGTIVRGTVMLDDSGVTTMGEVKAEPGSVRTGMRVKAVWADELSEEEMNMARQGWGVPGIRGWEPTGQPDVPADEVQRLLKGSGQQ